MKMSVAWKLKGVFVILFSGNFIIVFCSEFLNIDLKKLKEMGKKEGVGFLKYVLVLLFCVCAMIVFDFCGYLEMIRFFGRKDGSYNS